MPEPSFEPVEMLPVIRQLFDVLHQHDIRYCHWKNNPDHVRLSMSGASDVDVLFDANQKQKVDSVLRTLGFKRFEVVKARYYNDIEDYLFLDFVTGKLIHLHTHYRLTMGPIFSKNYQLDLEELILNKRTYRESLGVYGSTSAVQLLVLCLQESLKFRTRDKINVYLRRKFKFSEKVLREYNWLNQQVNQYEWKELIKAVFPDPEPIYQLTAKPFNKRTLLVLKSQVARQFADKRIFRAAAFVRWRNEFSIIYHKILKRITEPVISRRINPRGGVVIAVVGADGSGKSTVTKDIRSSFEKKLDVCRIYFGRGDGRISLSRKVLRNIKSILIPMKGKKSSTKSASAKAHIYKESKKGFFAVTYKLVEALLVANEKLANLRRMNKAKKKGMLVICDRFPQNQVMGYNDGPLLNQLIDSSNPLVRWLAQWEKSVYARAENNPPDLLIKLIANASIVEQRKPGETMMEKLVAKIDGIRELKMGTTMLTIDAARPLQEVLFNVRKEIWNKL